MNESEIDAAYNIIALSDLEKKKLVKTKKLDDLDNLYRKHIRNAKTSKKKVKSTQHDLADIDGKLDLTQSDHN